MNADKISHYMYGAGISMFAMGILLFILVVFMKNGRVKQDYYYIVTPWQGFLRRMKNGCIATFWLGVTIGGFVSGYLSLGGPYPVQGVLLFSGLGIGFLAMFIRSLRVLFERYKTWEEYAAEQEALKKKQAVEN